MRVEEVNRIAVIGGGQMGTGIAQISARAGYETVIRDVEKEILQKAKRKIDSNLGKMVNEGRISPEERKNTVSKISTTLELEEVRGSDLAVEAVPEDVDLKKDVFKELCNLLHDDAIIATNTSSIPITELAKSVEGPERFVGMHFVNPVPAMELVEIVKGMETSDKTLKTTREIAKKMGKTPVEVKDAPGFVLNRLLIFMINEAFYMLQEKLAEPEEIDRVMKLGANHPMGPLKLADLIGLDTVLHIMETLYEEFGDSKYRPCPLLRKYVRAGRLGKKTGEGVYRK